MKIKKSMCLILAALMISVPCVASLDSSVSAESYDDDIVDWAYSTWSDEYGRYDVYSSFSTGYWAGIWDPHTGTWIYDFKLGAVAASTGGGWSYGDDGVILATAFEINVTENGDSAIFSMLNTEEYVWSTPEADEQSDNLYLVSTLLMDLAMSAVSNLGVALTWTAVSFLIDSFANSVDEYSLQPNHIWRLWEWNNNIDECAQHMLFRVDVDPGETVTIRTTYNVFGYPFELMQPIPIYFVLTAPDAPSSSSSVMSIGPNQNGNVESISRTQLIEAVSEGLISESTAERLLSSNDDVFYIAMNTVDMTVVENVVSSNVDSSGDLDYVVQEIDRAQMIAHVFNRQNTDCANDIVEKYTQRLEQLNATLHLIQGADTSTSESTFLSRLGLSI